MSLNQGYFSSHFSDIAQNYRAVRFTDDAPITYILKHLDSLPAIAGLELGCGTGRYTAELLNTLDQMHSLHCVDASQDMLAELERRFKAQYPDRFTPVHSGAENVSHPADTLEAVFSFNALHHFDLAATLSNVSDWLRPGGMAFLYTRTPEQNASNLWGQFFPEFAVREDRLKSEAALMAAVEATDGLQNVEVRRFAYARSEDLTTILEKVDHYHYSTFRLYSTTELKEARETFRERLVENYPNTENITWTDYNLMVTARKVAT